MNETTPQPDAMDNSENDDVKLAADSAAPPLVGDSRFVDIISGQFDADEDVAELVIAKRVLAPMAETPKLHKVLAQAGMGSRLEMEQLILIGTQVTPAGVAKLQKKMPKAKIAF